MFIKFTRLDGTPIWLNSTFIVTVEPRRNGGSTVVPIGDGLDYDIREAPEKVLAMLGALALAPAADPSAPAAPVLSHPEVPSPSDSEEPSPEATAVALAQPEVVVAVPPPKALPDKFADVVSQGLSAPQMDEIDSKPAVETAVKTASGATITVSPADAPAPAKKPARKRKMKAEAAEGDAVEKPKKTTRTRTAKAKRPEVALDEAQLERLKKMAPGSVKKLQNTLASQFRINDVEGVMKALSENGIFTLEQDHVVWAT